MSNTNTQEMLLSDLLRDYNPIYPSNATWDETVKYLVDGEPELMSSLLLSVKDFGFRDPILLSDPEDPEYESPLVLDGTHRVAVAMLLGAISVPVIFDTPEWRAAYNEAEPDKAISVRVSFAGDQSYENEDLAFTAFRSFKLDDRHWAQSEMSSKSGGDWWFYYPTIPLDKIDRLERRFREIFKKNFPKISADIKVEVNGWAEET